MRKFVSGIVVVVMLLAVMMPVGWLWAFAEGGQTLFINEVMSSNKTTIRDGDVDDPTYGSQGGAYSDWIEIYNSGTQAVDLTGYTLSDSTATWTFPQGFIPAQGYLVIWASDKNKVASNGQLHTSFKLSASGESVTLKKPDGAVVDSLNVVSLADDQSYGRSIDGTSELVAFSNATPGSANVSDTPTSTLFINEVMASNASTIKDGDVEDPTYGSQGGAYSDWIEIYNSGLQAVDLTGYTLSDSSATWTFPQGVVPARGYLLVWASDKDKVAKDGQLHTNFKIGSTGEALVLKKPDGSVVDTVTTISLGDDESYGRKTDGSSELSLLRATPGAANIYDPSLVPVPEPAFSHEGGFFTGAFSLQLVPNETGLKIYYTTNGSDPAPGAAGTLEYTGGITVKSRVGNPNELSMIQNISNDHWNPWKAPVGETFKCTTIKAVAVRSDGAKSKIITHSYFVDPNMKTRYSLPVISLVTDKANLFDNSTGLYVNANYEKSGPEWERPVHVEFFEKDGTPGFSQYSGLRIHGGWTRKYPQKSFRLYADHGHDDVDKFKYEIFPGLKRNGTGKNLKSFERLILRNAGNDWTSALFRDEMMQSLVSHLKIDTQPYRPSIVFLNGEYWGIYHIRERYDHKYLADHYDLDDDKVAILDMYQNIEVQEGTPEDATAYTNEITNYLQSHSITEQSTYEYIKTKMDIDNYIDYNVAEIFFGNTDWPGNNVCIWKYKTDDGQYHPEAPYGQDGRWRWFLKDTDFGFGLYGKSVTHDTLSFATSPWQESYANATWATFLLRTLIQNSDFRNQFINHFADQLNTSFVPSRVNGIIDEVAGTLDPEMKEHTDRWPYIKMTSTDPKEPTWSETVQQIKNYADNRPSNVRQHILNKFRNNGVTGTASVSLNTNTTMGNIKINSIVIESTTPGVTNPGAWTGIYFRGVPVTVKAIPQEGYEFDRWEGVSGVNQSSDTVTFTLSGDTNITAVFKPSQVIPSPTPTIIPTPTPTTTTLYGDFNTDGAVDSTDLTLCKRYLLKIIGPESIDIKAADVDASGEVDSTDLTYLKRFLLKIIDIFPAQKL